MTPAVLDAPIRDIGLCIAGSPLEPVLRAFLEELRPLGLVTPAFYLGAEWFVEDGSVSISVPFWLADPDLAALQYERRGYVEGGTPEETLRYLRHEMGHVVAGAYGLHGQPAWRAVFGDAAQRYPEVGEPYPFDPCCRDHVRYLPGCYAQSHPDESWAETFASWVHPNYFPLVRYQGWPGALRKLYLAGQIIRGLKHLPPVSMVQSRVRPVESLGMSAGAFFQADAPAPA